MYSGAIVFWSDKDTLINDCQRKKMEIEARDENGLGRVRMMMPQKDGCFPQSGHFSNQ